ncbi:hypothetical protein [Brachybacterium saurashtrense]|uniref:Uncharacterized protein n=1 Tax=Brachybacterium saurashtrense TaxID=556288 RepID=A0A345YQP3_9MICO|nr:hypothetical protein [Brachybacterium saurashtrense]AXK46245.1 hypothetical protein DWV08_11915 [Brachybacterium saurashtrense]RRR23985.1 hypothetical protein DXU92_03665 [Brachybacterium saurashtrense]
MPSTAHRARRPLGVVLIGPALMVLVPLGTFAVGVSTSSRSAAPFVAIAVLHLLMLTAAAWLTVRALRETERWRPVDLAGPMSLAIGAGASLFLTSALARAIGIQGTAVPRLRNGIPEPADFPFVAAVGLACAVLLGAALSAVVPPMREVLVLLRRCLARWRSGQEAAASEGDARSAAGTEARSPDHDSDLAPAPVRYATSERDGILARLLSPLTRVLIVLAGLTSLGCLVVFSLTAQDPRTAELLTIGVTLLPALPMVWAVLESLWRLDESLGTIMAALWRTMTGPFVIAPLLVAPMLLVGALPPVRQGFSAQHMATIGDGGLVAADASVFSFLGAGAAIALAAGVGGGLAVSVAVVIPVVALLRPLQMVAENEMSMDIVHRRRNVAAVRAMAATIVMIFVFSTLMALYQNGQAPGWAALLSLLVLAGLVVAVFFLQRVDHEARARSGTSARVGNPADPRPPRLRPGGDDDGPSDHR